MIVLEFWEKLEIWMTLDPKVPIRILEWNRTIQVEGERQVIESKSPRESLLLATTFTLDKL